MEKEEEHKVEIPIKIEELNEPSIKKITSRRELKTIKEAESNYKFYGWDLMENYAYIAYLINFRHIFDSQLERKRVKVFRHLSKLIQTRNPHQIKSHHQKMMLRHQNVDAIIDFVKEKVLLEVDARVELRPVIEKINRDAELFFLKELGAADARLPSGRNATPSAPGQASEEVKEEAP
jgi:endo-alpha-1,4-polygalactosaminidase (GH114 family)